MSVKALIILLFLPLQAAAQGFAGIGTEAEGFATPERGTQFTFPADHGPHPNFRIEWWYLTANMTGPEGTPYGLQWTLFRSARAPGEAPGWNSPQVWFGHAAVTTPDAHFATERFARGGIGQAGVQPAPFKAWIDEWQMTGPDLNTLNLNAAGPNFAYDVALTAQAPLVFHGDAGYSVKSAQGQASYYYSQPAFSLSGTLTLPGGDVQLTGDAWLDREWSSQPLAEDQTGWDWFSLSFDTGDKLMAFRLRQEDGTFYGSGTWIGTDGSVTPLPDGAVIAAPVATSSVAGRDIPTEWRLTIPARDVNVAVTAINPGAWMSLTIPYWEGPVAISGSHSGAGYLEMTGYE